MKRMVRLQIIALAALLAALVPLAALAEMDMDSGYVENQWDFVDQSMDVSHGIPEDAMGVFGSVRESGVLRVATEPYYPPQEFIDPTLEGQASYVGADMELARLIAERMGVELVIVPMEFSEVFSAVQDGRCDLAISALSYTPGRAASVTLSKGYNYAGANAGSGLMIRAEDAEAITGVGDLEGRDILAQSGSLQESMLAENVFNYREFRRLASVLEIYDALSSGDADAAMVDVESAQVYIDNNPECGLMLVPGVRFQLEEQFDGDRVACKKGELQMMYFVNGVIDEVLESGQYRAWFEEYEARAAELDM